MRRCWDFTPRFAALKVRGPELYKVGQAHGEGLSEHPTAEDPYEFVFSLSRQFKILPSSVLDMDGELLLLFVEYLNGYTRGREIRREKGGD